jgi:hypothetical protein
LLRDHLHRAFIIDLLRSGSRESRRWWRGSRGYGIILSIIRTLLFLFILIIFFYMVQSNLPSDLH